MTEQRYTPKFHPNSDDYSKLPRRVEEVVFYPRGNIPGYPSKEYKPVFGLDWEMGVPSYDKKIDTMCSSNGMRLFDSTQIDLSAKFTKITLSSYSRR